MIVRSLAEAEPFTTADGSTIRELLGLPTAPRAQPEPRRGDARARPGDASATTTPRREEIYYVVEGSGEMELDGDRRPVGTGDAVLIPPGAWHQITAGGDGCASCAAARPRTGTRTPSSSR